MKTSAPPPYPLTRVRLSGALKTGDQALASLRGLLTTLLAGWNLPVRTLAEVELATSEAAANICEHAYRNRAGRPIRYGFQLLPRRLVVELQDSGAAFHDRKPVRRPDWDKLIEAEADGGFGRNAMKKAMDGVTDRRVAGKNVIRMVKRLDRGRYPHSLKPFGTS